MAYQKVGGTPRFYIDLLTNQKAIDNIQKIRFQGSSLHLGYNEPNIDDTPELINLIGLDPVNTFTFNMPYEMDRPIYDLIIYFKEDIFIQDKNSWFGVFNHNAGTINGNWWAKIINLGSTWLHSNMESVVNFDTAGYGRVYPEGNFGYIKDGFSIMIGTPSDPYIPTFGLGFVLEVNDMVDPTNFTILDIEEGSIPFSIGSIGGGTYYDMPTSPDLDLTMSIEYDGFTNIKTLNGSTITQANYQGSPWWYDKDGNKVEPWSVGSNDISKELSDGNPFYDGEKITNNVPNKRNGRRVWKLKFSYMSDKDLFASNYGNSAYMETNTDYDSADLDTDTDNNNIFYYNIDNDDSFSAQVLNKISHGEKFIFQPDNTANNPSDFAIAVLDGDSFSMKRTAWNVYDIEMTIREVW